MTEAIIEVAVQILGELALALLGILGAWVLAKIAKRNELTNISAAANEAVRAAQLTVMELQQTTVDAMKAASKDGKLTTSEIEQLGDLLLRKALDKMSESATNLLVSAGVDITALIKGAGEAMIQSMKK